MGNIIAVRKYKIVAVSGDMLEADSFVKSKVGVRPTGKSISVSLKRHAQSLSLFPFASRALPFSLADPPTTTFYPASAGLIGMFEFDS